MIRSSRSGISVRYTITVVLFASLALYSRQVCGSLTTASGLDYACIGSSTRLVATAVCDGVENCPLGDDEAYCDIPSLQEPICLSFYRPKAPCLDLISCVHLDWFCDNEEDCSDGEDEWLCDSEGNSSVILPPCPLQCICSGLSVTCEGIEMTKNMEDNISSSIRFLYLKQVKSTAESLTTSLFLDLAKFPHLVVIMAYSEDIHELGIDTFSGLQFLMKLDLQNSNIRHIEPGTFRNLSNLDYLNLSDNSITKVDCGTFDGLWKLSFLDLMGNNISLLEPGAFRDLHALQELELSFQPLHVLHRNMFQGLQSLKVLELSSNKITVIQTGAFNGMNSLESLILYGNQITDLRTGTFAGLQNLQELHLWNNNITTVESGAFTGISNTTFLDLENNSMHILQRGVFRGLDKLQWLNLGGTPIASIEDGAFIDVPALKTLSMLGTNITNPTRAMFRGLDHLHTLTVEDYRLCCFFTYPLDCHTPPGSFSSCDRLMPNGVLRFFIWLLGISAVFGNVCVMTMRTSSGTRMVGKVQSCLIANLAASDALMGIYMLIIGSADVYFGQDYFLYAEQWRTASMCKLAGFLSIVSCEASVFLVTVISLDRFISIAFPFTQCFQDTMSVRVTSTVIWLVAVAIGLTATLLGDHISRFYGMSDVCVGLPLKTEAVNDTSLWKYDMSTRKYVYEERKSSGETPAWVFSILIYLVLNLLCFLVVFMCYISIFILVKKSRKNARRSKNLSKEIKVAAKMALIVGTDFACWVPIIIMGILSQTGSLTIPERMYAWSVVFIIPINSSINPYLYTLSNINVSCVQCPTRIPLIIKTADTRIRNSDPHPAMNMHAYMQGADGDMIARLPSDSGIAGNSY